MNTKPPGPKGLSVFKTLREMGRVDPLTFWLQAHAEYGDEFRINLGWTAIWFFASPQSMYEVLATQNKRMRKGVAYAGLRKLLGEGLISTDKKHWLSQRQRLNPVFTPSAVNSCSVEIYDVCLAGIEELKTLAGKPDSADIDHAMKRLTMRIVSKAAFGIELSEKHDEIVAAFDVAFAFVADISKKPIRAPLFVPTRVNREFKSALATIDRFIEQLIEESQAKSADGLHGRIREALSENDTVRLRDEVVSLYFAGFETTSRTLTFALCSLANRPGVLSDLREEAEKLERPTSSSTFSVLQNQPLATEVVNEALRIYPPVAMMARQATETCVVGDYEVAANDLVIVCPFIAQRNPEFWPEEDNFSPSLEEPLTKRLKHRGAFLPFGAGQRVCLGQNFAMVELVLAVSLIVKNLEWELDDSSPVELDFHGTLRPAKPVFAKLKVRS